MHFVMAFIAVPSWLMFSIADNWHANKTSEDTGPAYPQQSGVRMSYDLQGSWIQS
jgi:hypothetical protein